MWLCFESGKSCMIFFWFINRKGASEKVPAATVSKDQPVKFCIADDDDDERDSLVKPPRVFIESPTSAKGGDQPTKV